MLRFDTTTWRGFFGFATARQFAGEVAGDEVQPRRAERISAASGACASGSPAASACRQHTRDTGLEVNLLKGKKLTNIRTHSK